MLEQDYRDSKRLRRMFARIKRTRLYVLILAAGLLLSVGSLLYALFNNIGDFELGQIDFIHGTTDFVRGAGLDIASQSPPAITVDSANGCVYVADTGNNRVLGWKNESSFANGALADIIIGQKDQWSRGANAGGLSSSSLSAPTGVAADPAGNLYIADNGNARVVEYDIPCNSSGPFIGNLIFNVGDPWGLAVDLLGNLFVADRNNNRVLEYNAPLNPASSEPGAGDTVFDNVFGQTTGITCNQGGPAPTASTLCGPYGVGTDGTNAYIADTSNNRVLEFMPISAGVFASDPGAIRVLGQIAFNLAASGCATGTSLTSLCAPRGVAVDFNHNVFVTDTGNNRITEYGPSPVNHGQATAILVGQLSGTGNAPNMGAAVGANTLSSPAGIAADTSANLFVLDADNDRALEFAANPSTDGAALRELGQVDLAHNTVDFVDGSALSDPSSVAVDRLATPQHLYVVDADNNRVLGFNDATKFTNGAAADLVIGQPDFYTTACNGPGVDLSSPPSATSLCLNGALTGFPQGGAVAVDNSSNVWVSDPGNGRVLEYSAPFAYKTNSGQDAGEPASLVLGQADFVTGTPPAACSPASATTLCEPAGLAFDSGNNLYAADFGANRVLVYTTPSNANGSAPQPASLVLGQGSAGNNFTGSNCNTGAAAPSADTLCGPVGLALDKNNGIYVTDYNNNRLLEYIHPLTGGPGTPGTPGSGGDVTADLVFGQDAAGAAFTSAFCNNGGIAATSLCQPSGVAVDPFGSVFVSDQTNNRLLIYQQLANPPANVMANYEFGQGQTGTVFNSGTPNLGGRSASSLNLAQSPGQQDGVAVDSNGDLYAVDAGNERVISYSGPFLHVATPSPSPTSTATPTPTATPTATSSPTPIPSPTPTTTVTAVPAKLKFEAVEATLAGKPKTLRLDNKGAVAAQFAQLSAAPSFTLSNDTCSNATVQPNQNCTVDVTFSPSATGSVSQTMTIPYNGASPAETLTGTGTAVVLKAPKSKTLPRAQAGALGKPINITISNKSAASVLMSAPVALA